MQPAHNTDQDRQDIEAALAALSAANQRAMASGRPVLVVRDNHLVQVGVNGVRKLKPLTMRRKVAQRIKRSR